MENLTPWPPCDSIAVYACGRTGRTIQYPTRGDVAPPRIIFRAGTPWHLETVEPVPVPDAVVFSGTITGMVAPRRGETQTQALLRVEAAMQAALDYEFRAYGDRATHGPTIALDPRGAA